MRDNLLLFPAYFVQSKRLGHNRIVSYFVLLATYIRSEMAEELFHAEVPDFVHISVSDDIV